MPGWNIVLVAVGATGLWVAHTSSMITAVAIVALAIQALLLLTIDARSAHDIESDAATIRNAATFAPAGPGRGGTMPHAVAR